MLSNTCKYAIRAVIYLAIHETPGKKIGIKQISKDLEIPAPFLGKILQQLARRKLLSSTKGPHGGFSLGPNGESITLLDIVDVIDGLDVFNSCLVGLRICKNDPAKQAMCPLHEESGPIRSSLYQMFKSQKITELADNLQELDIYVNL